MLLVLMQQILVFRAEAELDFIQFYIVWTYHFNPKLIHIFECEHNWSSVSLCQTRLQITIFHIFKCIVFLLSVTSSLINYIHFNIFCPLLIIFIRCIISKVKIAFKSLIYYFFNCKSLISFTCCDIKPS